MDVPICLPDTVYSVEMKRLDKLKLVESMVLLKNSFTLSRSSLSDPT